MAKRRFTPDAGGKTAMGEDTVGGVGIGRKNLIDGRVAPNGGKKKSWKRVEKSAKC